MKSKTTLFLASLLFVLGLSAIAYFSRDFSRFAAYGILLWIVGAYLTQRFNRSAGIAFVAYLSPVFLVLVVEIGFAGVQYAQKKLEEYETPSIGDEGRKSAKAILRSNPRTGRGTDRYNPIETPFVTINDFGLRGAFFEPQNPGTVQIGVLGGSAVFGTDVTDSGTLPRQTERALSDNRKPVKVVNLGLEFAASNEEVMLLQDLGEAVSADILVFFHGANDFNEAWSANSQETSVSDIVLDDTFYNRMRLFLRSSSVVQFYNRNFETVDYAIVHPNQNRMVEDAVAQYSSSRIAMEAYCHDRQLKCVFFLQPMLWHKEALTNLEVNALHTALAAHPGYIKGLDAYYDIVLERYPATTDMRPVFKEVESTVFQDIVHVYPEGNEVIAKALRDRIEGIIDDQP